MNCLFSIIWSTVLFLLGYSFVNSKNWWWNQLYEAKNRRIKGPKYERTPEWDKYMDNYALLFYTIALIIIFFGIISTQW